MRIENFNSRLVCKCISTPCYSITTTFNFYIQATLLHLDLEPHGDGGKDSTGTEATSLHRRGSALEGGNGGVGSARWLDTGSASGKPAARQPSGGGGSTSGVWGSEADDVRAQDADSIVTDAVEVVGSIGGDGRGPRGERGSSSDGQSVRRVADEKRLNRRGDGGHDGVDCRCEFRIGRDGAVEEVYFRCDDVCTFGDDTLDVSGGSGWDGVQGLGDLGWQSGRGCDVLVEGRRVVVHGVHIRAWESGRDDGDGGAQLRRVADRGEQGIELLF